MKKFAIVAAIAAAATFGVLALASPAAAETIAANTGVVADLVAPMPAAGTEYNGTRAAELTTFTPDGVVAVEWGLWIDKVLGLAALAIATFVTATFRKWAEDKIGKDAAAALSGFTEQAINYGINATRDAVRGKQLSVEVGNEVLERALEYGLRLFPDLIDKFGGPEAQRQRIMARLNLVPEAAIPVPRPPAVTFAVEPERPPMADPVTAAAS